MQEESVALVKMGKWLPAPGLVFPSPKPPKPVLSSAEAGGGRRRRTVWSGTDLGMGKVVWCWAEV